MKRAALILSAFVGVGLGASSCCGTLLTVPIGEYYRVTGWDGFEAPLSPAFVDVTDTEIILTHEGETGTLTVRYAKVEQLSP